MMTSERWGTKETLVSSSKTKHKTGLSINSASVPNNQLSSVFATISNFKDRVVKPPIVPLLLRTFHDSKEKSNYFELKHEFFQPKLRDGPKSKYNKKADAPQNKRIFMEGSKTNRNLQTWGSFLGNMYDQPTKGSSLNMLVGNDIEEGSNISTPIGKFDRTLEKIRKNSVYISKEDLKRKGKLNSFADSARTVQTDIHQHNYVLSENDLRKVYTDQDWDSKIKTIYSGHFKKNMLDFQKRNSHLEIETKKKLEKKYSMIPGTSDIKEFEPSFKSKKSSKSISNIHIEPNYRNKPKSKVLDEHVSVTTALLSQKWRLDEKMSNYHKSENGIKMRPVSPKFARKWVMFMNNEDENMFNSFKKHKDHISKNNRNIMMFIEQFGKQDPNVSNDHLDQRNLMKILKSKKGFFDHKKSDFPADILFKPELKESVAEMYAEKKVEHAIRRNFKKENAESDDENQNNSDEEKKIKNKIVIKHGSQKSFPKKKRTDEENQINKETNFLIKIGALQKSSKKMLNQDFEQSEADKDCSIDNKQSKKLIMTESLPYWFTLAQGVDVMDKEIDGIDKNKLLTSIRIKSDLKKKITFEEKVILSVQRERKNLSKNFKQKINPKKLFQSIAVSLYLYLRKVEAWKLTIKEMMKHNLFPKKPFANPGLSEFLMKIKRDQISDVKKMLFNDSYLVYHYDHLGMTGLHWAWMRGFYDIVKIILEYNPDVNRMDLMGRTPLFFSIKNNNKHMTRKLVVCGADPAQTHMGTKVKNSYLLNLIRKVNFIRSVMKMTAPADRYRRLLDCIKRFISMIKNH